MKVLNPHLESGNDWIALNQFESLFLMFFDVTSVTIATNYSTKWIQVNPNEVHRNGRARVQSKLSPGPQHHLPPCWWHYCRSSTWRPEMFATVCLFGLPPMIKWLNMILIVPKCAECQGTTKEMDWGIAEAYHGGLRCSQGEKELKSQTSCAFSSLFVPYLFLICSLSVPYRLCISASSRRRIVPG